MLNRALFTKITIDDAEHVTTEPVQTIATILSTDTSPNNVRTLPHDEAGQGSNVTGYVDLRREFENPCPPLKTLSLRRSRGLYKHDRRSSGPTVADSRGRMVRSLEMAQTLLRPEQVDDLVTRYRDGATLV